MTTEKDINVHTLYGGKVELKFEKMKHLYTVDGQVVDGVTSVLGVIAKPALIYWSANKAAEYIDLNLPVGEPIDEIKKKELVEGAKKAHRTLLSVAGDYGTLLHELIELYIKGKPYKEPVNDRLKTSFNDFKKWVADNNVEFKSCERKVYSRKYGYAGTLDFTATVNGKNVLGDLKTSSGIWDEMWLQLAAYVQALSEEFPAQKVDHSVIIRCGKDGSFEVKEGGEFEKNIEAFLGALTLYRRMKEMKFKNLPTNQPTT